jgi:hypothetical protein
MERQVWVLVVRFHIAELRFKIADYSLTFNFSETNVSFS